MELNFKHIFAVLLIVYTLLLSSCGPKCASITTSNVTNITSCSAVCGGEVINENGSRVEYSGVCWSTYPNPTPNDWYTIDGDGIGRFGSSLTKLKPNTRYYVRAYAVNAIGTSFGNELTFITRAELPKVETGDITDVTATSAFCGCNVTYDGGVSELIHGICWSTTDDPTINDNHVSGVGGEGILTLQLTGLAANTKYYLRSYATNSAGTVYGRQLCFTTHSGRNEICGHEYVDLGLPSGLLWATCNVGTSYQEGDGDHIAWGETTSKEWFGWEKYQWGYYDRLTKYNTKSRCGTVDNKIFLDPEDDIAHVEWGGSWRMPTKSELNELVNNCIWTYIDHWPEYDGCQVTGPNGNSIFLPCASFISNHNINSNYAGNYWSSSLNADNPNNAYSLEFYIEYKVVDVDSDYNRSYGMSVRPVSNPQK